MTEKPILFSTEMVQAILEGRKTMTRRVAKPQPPREPIEFWDKWVVTEKSEDEEEEWGIWGQYCPYGKRGDRLWVRETWATISCYDHLRPIEIPKGDSRWPKVWYYAPMIAAASAQNTKNEFLGKKRPSIFMPRWASRITLQVTSVRVERVQDITNMDAVAEGVDAIGIYKSENAHNQFAKLWDSINAKRGYGWKKNPWVWVVEFKRLEGEAR